MGFADNTSATTFGLRLNQLTVAAPAALASGLVKSIIAGGVAPSLSSCNLSGTGTTSWLLKFDTTANTLMLGGALPVADPTQGYSFFDGMLGGATSAPASLDLTIDTSTGQFSTSAGSMMIPISLPLFLDATGSSGFVLPIRSARVSSAKLSASKNCIGTYNADGLSPTNSCLPDATTPAFLDGASLSGFMTLEDADKVIIAGLGQSLCVLLSGDRSMYGMPMGNLTVCKRDSSQKILFAGDWCSTTNASSSSCSDAVEFRATFAAGSVAIR